MERDEVKEKFFSLEANEGGEVVEELSEEDERSSWFDIFVEPLQQSAEMYDFSM